MNSRDETLSEISAEAIRLLCREMGVAKTLRFLGQFNHGNGNYTEEREQIFAGMSVADIVAEIEKRRPNKITEASSDE